MKLPLIFIFLLLLYGCDEVFDDKFYIENYTDDDILLVYSLSDKKQADSLLIKVSEKKFIFNVHSAGGKKQHIIPIKNVFSNFDVFQNTNMSNYDYFDNDNWNYISTSSTTAEYTMVVDSTHFK